MYTTSKFTLPALLVACLLMSGCFQAQVTTNKAAGDTVVEEKWASSFVYGLVPAEVDVSDECPNGIASAERNISFLNGFVGALTFNLYFPQNITVTCAADGATSSLAPDDGFTLPEDATEAEVQETLSLAAVHSAISQEPVNVRVAAN